MDCSLFTHYEAAWVRYQPDPELCRDAADAVFGFYAHIPSSLPGAYALLGEAAREQRPFAEFAAGYATTRRVRSELPKIVGREDETSIVAVRLAAVDLTAEGEIEQEFGGTWKVRQVGRACSLEAADILPLSSTAPQSPAQPPTAPRARAEPGVIVLRGRGSQVTPPFTLRSGLAVAELAHEGRASFFTDLYDATGERVLADLAIRGRPAKGTTAFGVPRTGDYYVNLFADGTWSIRIWQPPPIAETDRREFSGRGYTATPLFELNRGDRQLRLAHDGQSNFIVKLLDARGRAIPVVNVIGPFEGRKEVQVREAGAHLLDVDADGPWTIRVE